MRICSDGDSGATLVTSGWPLGISCRSCDHRYFLTARQLEAHKYDRRQLRRLPLVCRCGACDLALYLIEAPGDLAAFLTADMAGA